MAWAKEHGVRCVDLLPAFQDALKDGPGGLFLDMSHFDSRGQGIAAQALVAPVFRLLGREPPQKD